jgi:hypothetical protein
VHRTIVTYFTNTFVLILYTSLAFDIHLLQIKFNICIYIYIKLIALKSKDI